MIRLGREYINYWLKAKNRHGVHSPFVYEFNDKCISLPVSDTAKKKYNDYRKQLLADNSSIEITDFGAGSKRLGNLRRIKDIARVSGNSRKYAHLIYRIVHHYKPQHMLELGTSLGLGTLMMRLGNPKGDIETVEGCGATHSYTFEHFPQPEKESITFHHSTFTDYIASLDPEVKFDFVFIDGDHRGDKVRAILSSLKRHLHDETIILLDDIRWSFDMQTMWESIVKSENFHVSVDLFKMGMLVPRQHQATEHFVIRY